MDIKFQEAVWKVSRQLPNAGWRGEGEAPPQSQSAGLLFHSDGGETRFLAIELDKLPTQAQLDRMTLAEFEPLFARATRL